MEQSTAEGVTPKLTMLIVQVTMLIQIAPDMESWNSWAENIMDPTILMGSCSLANSRGTPMITWVGLSPMQGSHDFHGPWGCLLLADTVLLLWLYLWGQGGWWTCHLDSGCGFQLPYAMGCHKCTTGLGPTAPAVASFLRSGGIHRLWCLCRCDFDPAGFQNLCIYEWG